MPWSEPIIGLTWSSWSQCFWASLRWISVAPAHNSGSACASNQPCVPRKHLSAAAHAQSGAAARGPQNRTEVHLAADASRPNSAAASDAATVGTHGGGSLVRVGAVDDEGDDREAHRRRRRAREHLAADCRPPLRHWPHEHDGFVPAALEIHDFLHAKPRPSERRSESARTREDATRACRTAGSLPTMGSGITHFVLSRLNPRQGLYQIYL